VSLTGHCEEQAELYNYTYVVPLESYVITTNNTELKFCNRALDDLYYFYVNYYDSLQVTLVGEYESYLAEARFYYPLIRNNMATITQHDIQLDQLMIYDDMVKNIHKRVWNNTDRNLTYYEVGIPVINNTAIAEAVWNYDGSILDNILTQFGNAIWQFIGGVAEIIN